MQAISRLGLASFWQSSSDSSGGSQQLFQLGFLDFKLISTVSSHSDLFSVMIKVFEAILDLYFTFIEILVI